ncbi:hypothetical protein JWS13_04955 (plasmid) [Rhodococcus pseudokoreensis]|uniref:Uncharacterized protein n=1 Tax=Rhodococcus pseudokoreensis TaxID=2811421 RepID=A0A974ZRT5_9NOCA|nr:DUF6670 family protein [Rhodococcus pseudokoreensis]QSE88015.1 hypothetical protein JWS13_04955 [Rhodococcus pseudokoreensis]
MTAILGSINRRINSRPFDAMTTPIHTPRGRYGLVHYGVIVPGLPDPLRFFNAILILGDARIPVFDNRGYTTTTPADSAWLLLGSAAITDGFHLYSAADDGDLAADGSHLRLGGVTLERSTDCVKLAVNRPDVEIELVLEPTSAVSQFARRSGLYDHWSVLCDYRGGFTTGGEQIEVSGLCTYEYARAVNLPMPVRFFTYHVLNIDANVQVLLAEQRGPQGLPLQRSVYVRNRDGTSEELTNKFRFDVLEHAEPAVLTPDGRRMQLPRRFSWAVRDQSGRDVVTIEGISNDDFVYGLGAGYVGSYQYSGTYRGRAISGTGYVEWIDRR